MISFSHLIVFALFCFSLAVNHACAQSIENASQEKSETERYQSLPALAPPPLLPERTPVDSALSVHDTRSILSSDSLSQAITTSVKAPLAWRMRAYKLRHAYENVPSRQVICNQDDALLALIAILPAFKLRVEIANSRAGELLAAPAETARQQRFIFSICETTPSNVIIKATVLNSSKQDMDMLQRLLDTLKADGFKPGVM